MVDLRLISELCMKDRDEMVRVDGYETVRAARSRLGAKAMRDLDQLRYDIHHAAEYPNLCEG